MAKQTQKTSARRLLIARVWFVAVFALLLAQAMVFAAESTFLQDVAIDNINTTTGMDLVIVPSSGETNITGTLKVTGQIWSSVTGFKFPDGTTMSTASASGINGGGAANYLAIWNGASSLNKTEGLYWDATNKRLGIGTTAPGYKLHIKTTSGWGGFGVQNTDAAGGPLWYMINDQGGNGAQVWLAGSGTSASYLPNSLVFANYLSGGIGFETNGANPRMFINNAGNVGIGTTSPSTKLQVKGTLDLANNTIQGVTNIKIKSGGTDHQMYNDGNNDLVIKSGTGGDVIVMIG